jgi:predicted transcriptional regulator
MTIDRRDTGVDEAAVAAFLDRADEALAEYDQGYADADATLRVLREHIDELRDATGG